MNGYGIFFFLNYKWLGDFLNFCYTQTSYPENLCNCLVSRHYFMHTLLDSDALLCGIVGSMLNTMLHLKECKRLKKLAIEGCGTSSVHSE